MCKEGMVFTMTERYANRFLEINELAHSYGHHFHITTMTCLFKVQRDIDIALLYDLFEEDGVSLRLSRNANDFYHTKRRKLTKVFYNQISFIFTDYSKKSIKVFSNGNVQITGLASPHDFETTKALLLGWLNKYAGTTEYGVLPDSEKTVMMNAHFRVANHIRLKACMDRLLTHPEILRIRYKPERYPAVNIKMRNNVSVFVFRTGNIIMSANSIETMMEAYQHLGFDPNVDAINVYPQHSTIHGYDLKAFTNCIY